MYIKNILLLNMYLNLYKILFFIHTEHMFLFIYFCHLYIMFLSNT